MSVTPETLYDAVQAEIAKYPTRRGAMLPALHLTQEAYGWLSPEALTACSDAIGFSPAYCQAVASFYDMFFLEPVGTHVIDVCTNLACALRGAGEVLEAFEQRARRERRRNDGRRRDHAAQGRVPGRLQLGAGGGGRRALPRARRARRRRADRERDPHRRRRCDMPEWTPRLEANVLLDFEGELRDLAAYEAYGGYAQLKRARPAWMRTRSIAELSGSALRGRGGAGFPTGRKASFLAPGRERYLVVNADESEPGSCKDRELMLRTPHALLEGILIVMNVLRLTRAYIYIRGEYLTESEVLEAAIAEAREAGYVGAPGPDGYVPEITVHRGAGAYICGEETALLASLNGFRGQPSAKPPFPAVSGAFERPTLLNNVETIATIPAILRRGAEDYKALGTEQSGGTHVMSISGHVLRPGNYEMPMSQTMGYLIEELAGGVPGGRALKAVIPGGASSPILGPEALDILCAPEALAAAGSMAGSAGVMVIDDTTCIVQLALRTAAFYTHESCGKCTPCREGTRWITDTLQRIEDGIAAPGRDRPRAGDLRQRRGQVPVPARRRLRDARALDDQALPRGVRRARRARLLPAARDLLAQLSLPAAAQPAAAGDGVARHERDRRRNRHARDRRPRADRAQGHAARAGRGHGRGRDPDLLLRAAARAGHRRLPHVPGRGRGHAEAAGRLHDDRRRRHEGAHALGRARPRARRRCSSSSCSTTRSTAPSATRAASARCRT